MDQKHAVVLQSRIEEAAAFAERTNKAAVLVVQQFPVRHDSGIRFPPVRESIANILAFVELGTAADLDEVLARAATFDWVAVDCDHKLDESAGIVAAARNRVAGERLLFFSDNQLWFDSALDMVQRIERGLSGRRVLVCGEGPLAESFAMVLPRIGAVAVALDGGTAALECAIVLGAAQKRSSIDDDLVRRLPGNASIYDLGIGNLTPSAADCARDRGMALYRLDNRAGLSSAIVRMLETDSMVRTLMGRARLRDVDVVAGGLLASAGAVIVDDIRRPTVIFGVADGAGRFKPEPLEPADRARVDYVATLVAAALRAAPKGPVRD